MSIKVYRDKRDFLKTTEPKGGKNNAQKLSFVVQRHHASRLHYDFRLEIDGVLKSWAVPKGPSLNPKDKRLAMMVEDHPYDYKNFEGEIPKGNYGAGVVSIWDKGFYESLEENEHLKHLKKGLKTGNLKFKLFGKNLKGEFALVKLKDAEQNAWLLIKHRDDFAVDDQYNSEDFVEDKIKKSGRDFKQLDKLQNTKAIEKEPLKPVFKPMLATLSQHVFDDENWLYEKKIDGYRILAQHFKDVKLISRNGIDYTLQFKKIANAIARTPKNTVIDGEIVIENKVGISNFQAIQNYEADDEQHILRFYVFDLPMLNGHDLRDLALLQRKELLKKLISNLDNDDVILVDHVKENGQKLFEEAGKNKWEGIIAKNAESEYTGTRSENWLKFKITNSLEVVICGYTKPAGSRKYFGALILGVFENNVLKYVGNCGTGFDSQSLKELHNLFQNYIITEKPFKDKAEKETSATWLKPVLICEVNYHELTPAKHLRHSVFKGLRSDKTVVDLKKENFVVNDYTDNEKKKFGTHEVLLTNQNKVFWKEEQIKKGDLLNYYESIADDILPYLRNKPLSLNRHPNGIDGKSFFQKDIDIKDKPEWLKTVSLHSESNNRNIDYLICDHKATLMYMINLGCIELNPWLSNYQHPNKPEFMVIDLDPHDIDFKHVLITALKTKEIFDRINIKSFVKTSGSKGLHIYIYLNCKYDYELVKNFARYIAQLVHEELPDITSVERSPKLRKNKIYIDYLQNRHGQTIAAPYSVRPKKGATVSTPLSWDEIATPITIADFNIFNTLNRVKEIENPWKEIFNSPVDLKKNLIKK